MDFDEQIAINWIRFNSGDLHTPSSSAGDIGGRP
jgi:hypothetical protein